MTLFDSLLRDSISYLPVLAWAALGLGLLTIQILLPRHRWLYWFAAVSLLGIAVLTRLWPVGHSSELLFTMSVVFDSFAQNIMIIGALSFLGALMMLSFRMNSDSPILKSAFEQLPELLICLMFSGFGLGVLVTSVHMSSLFLGLETLSIGLYAACGFFRTDSRSAESGFKYLMMGAFSTVILLFGLAFLYGATGFGSFAEIKAVLEAGLSDSQAILLQISILFLVVAFAFKLTLVPFHFYAPDVYEGAPSPVTFLLTTVVKMGAMAAAFRLFGDCLSSAAYLWQGLIVILGLASILVGNIMAIQQRSLKKLLTFSGISHSGFMVLTLAVPVAAGTEPLLLYMAAYTFMNIGLFATLVYLEPSPKPLMLDDLKGLVETRFWPAVLMAIFLLGLAGLPPFAGFLIKFWVLKALVVEGHWAIALVAAVGGIIGAAYYLRVLMQIFMSDEKANLPENPALGVSKVLYAAIFFGAVMTLCGGFRPQIYTDWILGVLALK